ncbi:zinc-ribbon domain-containing protein [Streptomyces avermitilis]|uniref:zinc-ribbon domain-containing protein n=1 Tax=Streptomyces avermitilis TaxID=33903 RepID=UPI00381FF41F
MWLQERNGGLTPEKATPKMQVKVWWRCPAGHEWEENISTRTTLPKWKNGDVAACRECVGYRVSYSYPDCGHTVKVTPESAAKKRWRCWDCQGRWWQENEPRLKKELSAAAKAAARRASVGRRRAARGPAHAVGGGMAVVGGQAPPGRQARTVHLRGRTSRRSGAAPIRRTATGGAG